MSKPKPVAAMYAWMLPRLCEVAREHGYALGLHGSMNRDLDLMAMPWVENAASEAVLVNALREAVDGFIVADGTLGGRWDPVDKIFKDAVVRNPEPKPHGRSAWNIHFTGGFYIDLSIMPLRPAT